VVKHVAEQHDVERTGCERKFTIGDGNKCNGGLGAWSDVSTLHGHAEERGKQVRDVASAAPNIKNALARRKLARDLFGHVVGTADPPAA
jgi:hypothetical protein